MQDYIVIEEKNGFKKVLVPKCTIPWFPCCNFKQTLYTPEFYKNIVLNNEARKYAMKTDQLHLYYLYNESDQYDAFINGRIMNIENSIAKLYDIKRSNPLSELYHMIKISNDNFNDFIKDKKPFITNGFFTDTNTNEGKVLLKEENAKWRYHLLSYRDKCFTVYDDEGVTRRTLFGGFEMFKYIQKMCKFINVGNETGDEAYPSLGIIANICLTRNGMCWPEVMGKLLNEDRIEYFSKYVL